MKKILGLAAALGLALCASAPALAAGTASTTVTVNDTLASTCTITSPSALSFSNFNGSQQQISAGALSVNCSNTSGYTIAGDAGANSANIPASAGSVTRAMKGGTSYLGYELFTNAGFSTVWNASNTLNGTGNGQAQTITVYATLPAQNIPAPGSYSDGVTATVTF